MTCASHMDTLCHMDGFLCILIFIHYTLSYNSFQTLYKHITVVGEACFMRNLILGAACVVYGILLYFFTVKHFLEQ